MLNFLFSLSKETCQATFTFLSILASPDDKKTRIDSRPFSLEIDHVFVAHFFFFQSSKSLNIVVNKVTFFPPFFSKELHFCTWNWPLPEKKKCRERKESLKFFFFWDDFWLEMTNVTTDKTRILKRSKKSGFRVQNSWSSVWNDFLPWVLILQKSLLLLYCVKNVVKCGLFSRGQKRSRMMKINYLTIIFPPQSQNNMEKCL